MSQAGPIAIRPAHVEDVPLILGFIRELAAYEKAEPEVVATEAQLRAALFAPGARAHALVCSVGGVDAGFAVYFFNFSTWQGRHGLYLEDLYVSPAHRKAGAGKAMLRHLARIAVDGDCGRFEWSVLDWNEPAIAFYRSVGAVPMDEWVRYRLAGEALERFAQGLDPAAAEAIAIRAVERFAEPGFTELVNRLLHDADRRSFAERFLGPPGTPPVASTAQQVRLGAFAGETLVGWSHAHLAPGGALYVMSSAVEPAYRRQGVYTRLIAAIEEQARAMHCMRVESHHRAANNAVIAAKLKAGYTIVGTEFTGEMGLLVKMCKQLDARRDALFQARAGVVEGAMRFFGPGEGR